MLKKYAPYFLIVAISLIPLFGHLGSKPLQIWDEARLATSSYEMHRDGLSMTPMFHGSPDTWSVKPPLLIWLQAISMNLFGVNEMAVRLPSAIAGLLTILLLFHWIRKLGYSIIIGVAVAVICLAAPEYNGLHGLRTADYEALLIFSLIGQLYTFFYFINSKAGDKVRYAFYFVIFLGIGVWTKGINAFFYLPVFAGYLFFTRKDLLKDWKRLLIVGVTGALLSFSYYLIRELIDPGYLELVWEHNIYGRYFTESNQHIHDVWYYFKRFPHQMGTYIIYTVWIIPLGLILSRFDLKKPIWFLFISSAFFMSILSYSSTKTPYYNIQLIPNIALLLGLSIAAISDWVHTKIIGKEQQLQFTTNTLIVICSLILLWNVTNSRFNESSLVKGVNGYYDVTNFLRAQADKVETPSWKFVDSTYSPHNWWYILRMQDAGAEIDWYGLKHLDSFDIGDTILTNQSEVLNTLSERYKINPLIREKGVELFVLE